MTLAERSRLATARRQQRADFKARQIQALIADGMRPWRAARKLGLPERTARRLRNRRVEA